MQRNNDARTEKAQDPLKMRAKFTQFPNEWAATKTEFLMSLPEFGALIEETVAPTKEQLPWFKAAEFGDDLTLSPSGNCLRCDANVLAVTGVEADYDMRNAAPC